MEEQIAKDIIFEKINVSHAKTLSFCNGNSAIVPRCGRLSRIPERVIAALFLVWSEPPEARLSTCFLSDESAQKRKSCDQQSVVTAGEQFQKIIRAVRTNYCAGGARSQRP